MKELTIEQKAKRYDEAIETAKEYYNKGKVPEFCNHIASDIFPEVKNSEDERLLKTTIAFLKEFADKGYENAVECIDWLKTIRKINNYEL